MFNRRELLLGVAGSAAGVGFRRSPVTLDLVIGPKGEPGIVRAVLENVAVEALTGIGASRMRGADSSCSPWLTMELRQREARVSLRKPKRECVISLRNGCEGFVASWALPVVQHGVIGYDPGLDLPLLLTAGAGEYWCLREGAALPASLGEADAVYACFFGDYEERTFERMQVAVERLAGTRGELDLQRGHRCGARAGGVGDGVHMTGRSNRGGGRAAHGLEPLVRLRSQSRRELPVDYRHREEVRHWHAPRG